MKKQFKILLFIWITFYSQKAICQNKSQQEVKVDEYITNTMNKSGIVGIGAAVIVNKKLVWTKGYGYADRDTKTPFTPNTIMNVASIAKTFTGVCIMKAVEEGKLSLDEDINKYLPFKVINPNFPNEKITLRHLTTHTSSLTDRYPFYGDSTIFYGGKKPEPLGEFLKNYFTPTGKYYSQDNFLKSKPGQTRDYSNVGAGLAGYIVEIVTGKHLKENGKQLIFKPLKMNNTAWALADIDTNKHTKLYDKKGEKISKIEWYEGTTYPDGGIRTTVNDLSKFFIAMLSDGKYKQTRILKEETAKEMVRFQHNETNKPDNIKLDKLNQGIFWATKLGATRMGHNGSDPGVRTFMLSDLSKEIGVIIFYNTSLNENEEGVYFDIYEKLYEFGKMIEGKIRK
jgi:CubicO group peptidase (beta-lactamase class C family)